MIFPPGKCASDEVFETNEIQGYFFDKFVTMAAVSSVELSSTTTIFAGHKLWFMSDSSVLPIKSASLWAGMTT